MTENVKDVAAERDALRAENDNLRTQLAAAGAARPGQAAPVQHTFQLSEGDRQELEMRGVINVGGRQMTKDEVMAELRKTEDQRNVKIADAPDGTRVDVSKLPGVGKGVAGVDFVYPSVERGKIDPAVAGTPGISGPPADKG
jgi:hypothetical protein